MAFTKLTEGDLANTLVAKLGPVADNVRDLAVSFGLRPYQVRIVRTRWSSGERGVGQQVLVSTLDILPVPVVFGLDGLDEELTSVGYTEIGVVSISQISTRYTEDELRYGASSPLGDDESSWWEIDRPGTDKRRFTLSGTPEHQPGSLQWVVNLDRAVGDRSRAGVVE